MSPSAYTSDRPLTGILLIVAAMTLVPIMDGIAKHLSARYAVTEIVWARYFFHLLILLPLVLRYHGRRALILKNPWLQWLRGGFVLSATALFFAAIARMPIADALALVFVSPMIVTVLSALILKEQVGPRRWLAVLVGFGGALIIIRPGIAGFDLGSLLALGAGVVYACFIVTTRKLSGSAAPLVTLTYTALVGTLIMSLLVPWYWQTPQPGDLVLMIGMGAIAAASHFMIIKAFDCATASLLAPYNYAEIVMATLVGWLWFGDFPDGWTWCGMAVIVISGFYISLREQRR